MIRLIKENDKDEVLKIWLDASILAHDFVPKTYWEEKVKDMRDKYLPQSITFVYEINKEIHGFISLVDNYIAAIFIAPNHQGNGLGTKLIDYAKTLHKELYLGVYSKNRKSISFYLKQNFEIIEEKIEPYTGELESVMVFKNE